MSAEEQLNRATVERSRDLYESLGSGGLGRLFSPDEQMMDWVIEHPRVKASLFRLVDVLPALDEPADVLDHLRAYLGESEQAGDLPRWVKLGLSSSRLRLVPDGLVARTAQWSVRRLGDRFIAGSDLDELADEIQRLEREGFSVSIDRLGEEVVSESEVKPYRDDYRAILQRFDNLPGTEVAHRRRRSLSVKLTALDSQFDALARKATLRRLEDRVRPLLDEARKQNVIVYFDMEDDSTRELTLALARRLLDGNAYSGWGGLGVVIQAYHRESYKDCENLLEWCRTNDRQIWVRLVKGAYWDYERIRAYRNNWNVPVYEAKGRTDANFEAIARMLGEYHPVVKPAFGSHNLRSLAYGISVSDYFDLPRNDWELQMLYGMGDPIQSLMNREDYPVRLYVPYGDLLPGMAYLVRRLLENTSNESFLRQTFHESEEGSDPFEEPDPEEEPVSPPRREGYHSVGPQNFNRIDVIEPQETALKTTAGQLGLDYPLRLDGQWLNGDGLVDSYNPSRSKELIGRVARTGEDQLEHAIETATGVFGEWREVDPFQRADWLDRLGERLEADRRELASWVLLENGKTWREADADVMEAIDFCYYYAERMRELAAGQHWDWPGEENTYGYEPRGPAAVISPWNFPLAILTGMTTAALVTGNPVLLKPSSRTPVVAYQFVKRAVETGLPEGVLQLLPGSGSNVGQALVEDPRVNIVAFTGSRRVGTRIHEDVAKQKNNGDVLKQTVLEMGGKNAIIVDRDANLDVAVEGIIRSAFGYQGQKCSACSRVLLPEDRADEIVERLAGAASSLRIGPATAPENFMGPVIDAAAAVGIRNYQEEARTEGEVVLEPSLPEDLPEGHYVGAMVVDRISPESPLAREEIFGPVLPVLRYSDLEEAVSIANDVPYALTGGFYSRHPEHIETVKKQFRVGNLYVNEKITGAIVGRQPFGGFKQSGTGTKAGGPDYLKNFLWPRSTSENTVRRGFSPDEYL